MNYDAITVAIYLAGNIFRICIIVQFLKAFLKATKFTIPSCVLYFIMTSAAFLFLQIPSSMQLMLNFVCIFIIALTYVGMTRYKFLLAIVILTINLICEDGAYRLCLTLDVEHILVVATAISDLVLLVITLLINRITNLKKGEDISTNEWIAIFFIPGVSIYLSAIVLDECVDEVAITAGAIGLLALNIFVFYILEKVITSKQKQIELNLLRSQNEAYENELEIYLTMDENAASLRHDMMNHMLVLQLLAQKGNNTSIEEYLNKLIPMINTDNRFSDSGNIVIDSLLNNKIGSIKDCADIHINVNVPMDSAINKKDLCIVIGNLLDNAIDAIKNCKGNNFLNVDIREKQNVIHIEIENTYDGNILPKGRLFRTTKEEYIGHGIGLKNVSQVVEKYSGEIEFTYTESFFNVKVLMYKE